MPDARCRYRIIRTGVDATVQHSAIASIGSTITMLESYSGCISETRTSYWKATLIQQKENILFFKADKKYVYLEFLTMGDENAPKEHIPIVRMCKPCVAFMGEYFWSKYLPKERVLGRIRASGVTHSEKAGGRPQCRIGRRPE